MLVSDTPGTGDSVPGVPRPEKILVKVVAPVETNLSTVFLF